MAQETTNKLKDPVRTKEKISFAMANIGNIPIITLCSAFLLIFYTNIVGLNPAACATLFLVARIFDGVSDSFMGYYIDHLPNTKWGHFRPPLVIGTVLCVLNFGIVWFGPLMATGYKLVIAYISYLLLGVIFDVMDISLNSLLPVMTTDEKERSSLSAIKGIVYMIGMMVINVVGPFVIADTNEAKGYIVMIVACMVVALVFSLFGAAGIKERIKPKPEVTYSIKELFKILGQRPVWIVSLASLFMTTGMLVMNTINTYFYTYVVGDFSLFGIASGVGMVCIFPAIIISGKLVKRIGKKKLFIFGLLLMGVCPIFRLLGPANLPILFITTAIVGFGQGLTMPLAYNMQADNTDYIEINLGKRAEAAIASLSSLVTKCAMGIGGAIPGYLLAMSGFNANLPTQSSSAMQSMIMCVTVVPAVLTVIGAIIMGFGYPLTTQKLKEQGDKMRALHAQRTE